MSQCHVVAVSHCAFLSYCNSRECSRKHCWILKQLIVTGVLEYTLLYVLYCCMLVFVNDFSFLVNAVDSL